jgi:hypothetical protein
MQIKKHFFENALIDLTIMRNPFAVVHVNKTLNRDMGYGEKIEVEHTHTHSMLPVEKFSMALRLQIEAEMKAIQAEEAKDSTLALGSGQEDAIDVSAQAGV